MYYIHYLRKSLCAFESILKPLTISMPSSGLFLNITHIYTYASDGYCACMEHIFLKLPLLDEYSYCSIYEHTLFEQV